MLQPENSEKPTRPNLHSQRARRSTEASQATSGGVFPLPLSPYPKCRTMATSFLTGHSAKQHGAMSKKLSFVLVELGADLIWNRIMLLLPNCAECLLRETTRFCNKFIFCGFNGKHTVLQKTRKSKGPTQWSCKLVLPPLRSPCSTGRIMRRSPRAARASLWNLQHAAVWRGTKAHS